MRSIVAPGAAIASKVRAEPARSVSRLGSNFGANSSSVATV
ncbi:MAG TPA: hypothetical protein VKP69_33485 [Isosphaeraceae bacterium]|nr:hypothetical protein [Isosphaeraceae bacterium]